MQYILFGESHGPAIGISLSGVPAGCTVDMAFIQGEMQRRAPGNSPLATPRTEKDAVRIVSGVRNGVTTGSPLCALIENTDTRSGDYAPTQAIPRPGHADYTGHVRYQGFNDHRGGGHFSGRLTAPLVFAGALAKLILRDRGISVMAHIASIDAIADTLPDFVSPDLDALKDVAAKSFPVLDDQRGQAMQQAIIGAKDAGDSLGGSIRCFVCGVPAGCGGPDMHETLEGLIARHLFSVPAVKALEFGSGFALAAMRGSSANDPFIVDAGAIRTRTNHNGGINGGISNGMPVVFRVAIKPTPSIALQQESVDMRTHTPASLSIQGRHDPCIVPRAVPVIEAAAALAVCEALHV